MPATRYQIIRWAGTFMLANALLAMLVATRYLEFMTWPDTSLAWTYLFSMTLGHFFFLSALLFVFLVLPLALLIPRARVAICWSVTLYSACISLMIIDTFVFAQYRFHMSPFVFDLLIKGGGQIFNFSLQTWLTAAAVVVAIITVETVIAGFIWRRLQQPPQRIRGLHVAAYLFALFIASHIIHAWAYAQYDRSVTSLTRYYPMLFPTTAQSFMAKHGWINVEENRKNKLLQTRSSNALDYPKAPLICSPPERKLNLMMVILDTWRFDAMNDSITPNIHAFSKNSLVFTRHFSGGNGTRTGIFSLFYGLPGAYWHAFERNQRGPVLMEELISSDYRTGVFASATLASPEFDRTVFTEIDNLPLSTPGKSPHERDRAALGRWQRWLENHQQKYPTQPFFGFLFLDALHGYSIPADYPKQFSPAWETAKHMALNADTDPTPYRNLYNNIAHFEDSLVDELLDDLANRQLLRDTIVLITSDHGDEFNDNGLNYWGHNSNFSKYQTQVPMIVYWPGREPQQIDQVTSHLDVAPTILRNLLGCSSPGSDYASGRDLFGNKLVPLQSLILSSYSTFAVYDIPRKQLTVRNSVGLYDIMTEELAPLEDAKPDVERLLDSMQTLSRFYR